MHFKDLSISFTLKSKSDFFFAMVYFKHVKFIQNYYVYNVKKTIYNTIALDFLAEFLKDIIMSTLSTSPMFFLYSATNTGF